MPTVQSEGHLAAYDSHPAPMMILTLFLKHLIKPLLDRSFPELNEPYDSYVKLQYEHVLVAKPSAAKEDLLPVLHHPGLLLDPVSKVPQKSRSGLGTGAPDARGLEPLSASSLRRPPQCSYQDYLLLTHAPSADQDQ